MLHERVSARYRIQDSFKGNAIHGIVFALPIAAALWVAIAGVVFLIF